MVVIAQIAAALHNASYPAFLVSSEAVPESLAGDLPVIPLKDLQLKQGDRWIVPEGWPMFLGPGMSGNADCALYVQNWAFLHGLLPEKLTWPSLPLRMISVSYPVAVFIEETTGLDAPVISPAINPELYFPPAKHQKPLSRDEKVRIAWMPRKNKNLASQIRAIFEARLSKNGNRLPEWIAIDNLSPADVGETMRHSDIFLITGFPEGCPLPPLEAMACGCIVAGFTGIGGWDYMRQGYPEAWEPYFNLPQTTWGQNGFFVPDGDVWGASKVLEEAYNSLFSDLSLQLRKAGFETAAYYNAAHQRDQVLSLWADKKFWKCANR